MLVWAELTMANHKHALNLLFSLGSVPTFGSGGQSPGPPFMMSKVAHYPWQHNTLQLTIESPIQRLSDYIPSILTVRPQWLRGQRGVGGATETNTHAPQGHTAARPQRTHTHKHTLPPPPPP